MDALLLFARSFRFQSWLDVVIKPGVFRLRGSYDLRYEYRELAE